MVEEFLAFASQVNELTDFSCAMELAGATARTLVEDEVRILELSVCGRSRRRQDETGEGVQCERIAQKEVFGLGDGALEAGP